MHNNIREELIQDFVENYMEKIFYFCLKKTSDKNEAEDLTQDIALNIIKGLNKGIVPNNFKAWVWQIARNIYSKWATSKRIKKEIINSIDIYDIEVEDSSGNVIEEMIHEEQLALLKRELSFIKSEYRNIIVAYYLENKSIKAIAQSLKLSIDAVHQRLHRARVILKEGMNMVRTFGKRSYNPENIAFVMSGSDGKKGQPWSIITHLLYKNIFLEVYENPETAEELALELGIALPYMEDELEFLCREELIRKIGNKYETIFKIITREEQLKIHNENIKHTKEITSKLCEMIDLYMMEVNKKIDITSVSYENAKWLLLMRFFDYILLTAPSSRRVSNKEDEHPKRPDGGHWTITGYEYPIDFEEPKFVGLHGYECKDSRELKKDIDFGQYKFYKHDLYNKTPEYLNHNQVYQLWLVVNNIINETDNRYIEELLKLGYIIEENGKILPNIVVFTSKKGDNSELCNINRLSKLRQEITNCMEKAKNISRGYIIEQALIDGWLKFDENTIKTVGAYIYK